MSATRFSQSTFAFWEQQQYTVAAPRILDIFSQNRVVARLGIHELTNPALADSQHACQLCLFDALQFLWRYAARQCVHILQLAWMGLVWIDHLVYLCHRILPQKSLQILPPVSPDSRLLFIARRMSRSY